MIIKRRHPNSFIASLAYQKCILHKNIVSKQMWFIEDGPDLQHEYHSQHLEI